MPKRCIFFDDIECFAEECFRECRHHPHSGYIYLKENEELKKKPEHEKLKKVSETLILIVGIPIILIFVLLSLVLGIDIDFDRLSAKELAIYLLLVYGLAAIIILAYFSPPLYLPSNLAIVALFLSIGGPIILVCCLVLYSKMKKRKKVATWDLKGQAERQATSEVGYGLMELKEQLGRGDITPEEYEWKKKSLEGLTELKLQLGRGDITFEEYYQKKKKLLEKSKV